MAWWEIVLILVTIVGISLLFGVWDKATFSTEKLFSGPILLILTVLYVISTGSIYVTFALWHKFLGPYLFK